MRITQVPHASVPDSSERGGQHQPHCKYHYAHAVSVPTLSEAPEAQQPVSERPPNFESYRPPRTTAEGGATMLVSGVFAAGAVVVILLAVYAKLADSRTFGQISNLLTLAVALLLLAIYILVWEIAIRLISRTDD